MAEKAILEEALRYAAGDVLAPEMKKELAKHDLIRAEIKGRMVCTTEEAHGEEQAVGKSIWSGRGVCAPLLAGKAYLPEQRRIGGVTLDREQTEVIGRRARLARPHHGAHRKIRRRQEHHLGGPRPELRDTRSADRWPSAPTATASRKNLRD